MFDIAGDDLWFWPSHVFSVPPLTLLHLVDRVVCGLIGCEREKGDEGESRSTDWGGRHAFNFYDWLNQPVCGAKVAGAPPPASR